MRKAYYDALIALVASLSLQVKQQEGRSGEAEPPSMPIKEGERVWLKVIKRKWTEPKWTGPNCVEAATLHSVRLMPLLL